MKIVTRLKHTVKGICNFKLICGVCKGRQSCVQNKSQLNCRADTHCGKVLFIKMGGKWWDGINLDVGIRNSSLITKDSYLFR